MGYDVVDLKFGQLPQKPPQLEDSESNQNNDNDNNNNNELKDESSNLSEISSENGAATNNANGTAANGSCSCCHVCRRSMKATQGHSSLVALVHTLYV